MNCQEHYASASWTSQVRIRRSDVNLFELCIIETIIILLPCGCACHLRNSSSGCWQAPAYTLPSNLKDVVVMRVLVRHGISRDLGDLFVEDVKRSLEYFKKHEVNVSLNEDEGGGFSH